MLHLSKKLQEHLGLLPLRLKPNLSSETTVVSDNKAVEPMKSADADAVKKQLAQPVMPKPELEKNEFRLLVKILQAIGHECSFERIEHSNNKVIYHHPHKDLIFHDITKQDDDKFMYLSSLADMNKNSKLKRAVWEKLKTLT